MKRQLGYTSKKWSYLEDEFENILTHVKDAHSAIKSMLNPKNSLTNNMMDLFKIHSEEFDKILGNQESDSHQDECLICLEKFCDSTPIMDFLSQQKDQLSKNLPLEENIKQKVDGIRDKLNHKKIPCCETQIHVNCYDKWITLNERCPGPYCNKE